MKRNKLYIVIAVLLSAVLLLAGCSVNPGGSGTGKMVVEMQDQNKNTLTVSANGELKVTPDVAYVTVGVVTQDANAGKAQNDNKTAMNTLFTALKGAGLTDKDIKTIGYSVNPVYDYSANANGKISMYQATNTVKITVRDIEKVGEYIDIAADCGANTNYSIEFSLLDQSEYYNKALTDAVVKAKGKADAIAAAGGYTVIRTLSVAESSSSPTPYYYTAQKNEYLADAGPKTPISTGEITVNAGVTIVYELG